MEDLSAKTTTFMRAFSPYLRERVLAAALSNTLSQAQVAQRFAASLSFAEKLLRRYPQEGHISPRPHGVGRQRIIMLKHEPVLVALLVLLGPPWSGAGAAGAQEQPDEVWQETVIATLGRVRP